MIPAKHLHFLSKGEQRRLEKKAALIIRKGPFIFGPDLEKFEKELASYIGARYCLGVGSGTDAIRLSLMALGIGRGDEVITTNFTAYPTISGITQTGASPVVVDVRAEDGLINPDLILKAASRKTKAIIPVHLFGKSCDMKKVNALARKKGWAVVEDCAQSFGTVHKGVKTGAWGACGAFSFYPTKNLGGYGDGGAVTTNSPIIFKKLSQLRNYGQSAPGSFSAPGINSRLDEIQAALLRIKLPLVDKWVRSKNKLAAAYRNALPPEILLETDRAKGFRHSYNHFVVKVPKRALLIKALKKKGIGTLIHYPYCVSRQKAFTGRKAGPFPHAEWLASRVLSLPMDPDLSIKKIEFIARTLSKELQKIS